MNILMALSQLEITGAEVYATTIADELIERADYVSEIQKIKHPFDKGIPSRIGIEK